MARHEIAVKIAGTAKGYSLRCRCGWAVYGVSAADALSLSEAHYDVTGHSTAPQAVTL